MRWRQLHQPESWKDEAELCPQPPREPEQNAGCFEIWRLCITAAKPGGSGSFSMLCKTYISIVCVCVCVYAESWCKMNLLLYIIIKKFASQWYRLQFYLMSSLGKKMSIGRTLKSHLVQCSHFRDENSEAEGSQVIDLRSQGEQGLGPKHTLDFKPLLYHKTLLWGWSCASALKTPKPHKNIKWWNHHKN